MTEPVKKLGEKIKAAGASFELDSVLLYDAISATLAAMTAANSIDHREPSRPPSTVARAPGFTGSFGPAVWGAYQSIYRTTTAPRTRPMVTTYDNGKLTFEWLPWDGKAADQTLRSSSSKNSHESEASDA